MQHNLAKRMAGIAPFHVMAISARAKELESMGKSVIHMEIGEPDFPTPEPIIHAATSAIAKGNVHYTPAAGLPVLREAIAGFYRARYNVYIDPKRIIITPGASGALLLSLSVLISPGNSIVMADPGYPCNRHFVRLLEGETINVPVDAETRYQLNAALIDQYWQENTIAALVASPANPTGTLINTQEMREIAGVIKACSGQLLVDEIYHGLTYEEDVTSVLQIEPNAFVVNSFSKYFHMTGWRLGWLVAPESYVSEIEKLAQNIFLAASTPAQYAGLAAFQPDTIQILELRKQELKARRDFLLVALRELGFKIPVTPAGAFYIYADCSQFTDDSFTFAQNLLEQKYVAVTPGVDFGRYLPERHIRFAYTTNISKLEEAVKRIKRFLNHHG